MCISIGELVKPLHKIIFLKLIFTVTLAIYWNHIYFFRNYILDVCENWWFRILLLLLLCQLDNKNDKIFVVFYLLSNPLRLEEARYKLSMLSGSSPVTYFLNSINMIVIVNYTYVWECLGCLDICYVVWSFRIKCMLSDILSKLTIDVLW